MGGIRSLLRDCRYWLGFSGVSWFGCRSLGSLTWLDLGAVFTVIWSVNSYEAVDLEGWGIKAEFQDYICDDLSGFIITKQNLWILEPLHLEFG